MGGTENSNPGSKTPANQDPESNSPPEHLTNFQKLKQKISDLPINIDFENLKNINWKSVRKVKSP